MDDMSNISVVNGELVDYEYDRQKQRRDKIRNIRKWITIAALSLLPIVVFLLLMVYVAVNEIQV